MELEVEYNRALAEDFAETMIDTLNKSALSFMLSIGHRTKLFDCMAEMDYASSDEIARSCNLNERYVREWLGAMVTGKIVNFDPISKTYHLPAEHAAFLTRKAGPDNFGSFMQYFAVLGGAEDEVFKAFYNGNGVGYENFHRFHEVMAEESENTVLSFLDTAIIPLVPDLEENLKLGFQVLDIGCGSGKVMNYLADEYKYSTFTGLDFSKEAITTAERDALTNQHYNVDFELRDLSDFDQTAPSEKYDLITAFDAIHDQGQPLKALKGIYKALKPNGVFLMQDIGGTSFLEKDMELPLAPMLYTISCFHCMSVSLAQPNGEGVGAMWGEALTREYLHQAGFSRIETHQLPHDIVNNWYVVRK